MGSQGDFRATVITTLDVLFRSATTLRSATGAEIGEYAHTYFDGKRNQSPSEINYEYAGLLQGAVSELKEAIRSAPNHSLAHDVARETLTRFLSTTVVSEQGRDSRIAEAFNQFSEGIISVLQEGPASVESFDCDSACRRIASPPGYVVERIQRRNYEL